MSVTIRLSRQGAKKNPNYLIVAASSQGKRDGAYLESLGQYFPKAKTAKEKIKVNRQAVDAWIAKGAKPTQTVGQLLKTLAE
jgi:small subunit ribosomal protein S16